MFLPSPIPELRPARRAPLSRFPAQLREGHIEDLDCCPGRRHSSGPAGLSLDRISAPDPGPGQVQILRNDASRIGVRNLHGEWWIAKRCVSGRKRVGPGYVYLVKRKGKVVVDDAGKPILDDPNGGLNPYGSSGGLGSFGYQHARGVPPFQFSRHGGGNTWWVSSRVCAGDHPQFRTCSGFPEPEPDDPAGTMKAPCTGRSTSTCGRPGRTRFFASATSTSFRPTRSESERECESFCAKPTCGDAPQQHFAKEPKFTMQVTPAAGDAIAVYNESGVELTRWAGGHPRKGTGQVGDDSRDSVTFTASGLNVVARGASGRWEGSAPAWTSGRSPPPGLPRAEGRPGTGPLRERKRHALGLQRRVSGRQRRQAVGARRRRPRLPARRLLPRLGRRRGAQRLWASSRRFPRRARFSRTTSSTRSRQTAVTAPARSRRSLTNSASSTSPAWSWYSSNSRQVARTVSAAASAPGTARAPVLAQLLEPIDVHGRLLGAERDDDQVPVPGTELVEATA